MQKANEIVFEHAMEVDMIWKLDRTMTDYSSAPVARIKMIIIKFCPNLKQNLNIKVTSDISPTESKPCRESRSTWARAAHLHFPQHIYIYYMWTHSKKKFSIKDNGKMHLHFKGDKLIFLNSRVSWGVSCFLPALPVISKKSLIWQNCPGKGKITEVFRSQKRKHFEICKWKVLWHKSRYAGQWLFIIFTFQ